jgi:hypothetical protein
VSMVCVEHHELAVARHTQHAPRTSGLDERLRTRGEARVAGFLRSSEGNHSRGAQ